MHDFILQLIFDVLLLWSQGPWIDVFQILQRVLFVLSEVDNTWMVRVDRDSISDRFFIVTEIRVLS